MESKKIKEIKTKLQEEIFIATSFDDKLRRVPTTDLKDLLTLINEFESENERLQKDCMDITKDYQEMAKFYDEKCEECDSLKQQLNEMWTFKTTQDGKCNILDIVRRVERKETAKDILNGLEWFFWETASNDTKFFEFYESLYKGIKEFINNKYEITKENENVKSL